MSSHREAPAISQDPVADSTDVYAFVSPDNHETVTILANYLPLQDPAGGPNFFEFGDDVLYQIGIDNNGDGVPEVAYQFRFTTATVNPNTFLYNTSTITPPPFGSATYPNFNRPQTYQVTRVDKFRQLDCSRVGASVPAVQHRTSINAQLPGTVGTSRQKASLRHHRLRRATG